MLSQGTQLYSVALSLSLFLFESGCARLVTSVPSGQVAVAVQPDPAPSDGLADRSTTVATESLNMLLRRLQHVSGTFCGGWHHETS